MAIKFVNEIVFLAFHIVPVYEVAYFADVLVLNSIEFWSGSNPIAQVGTEKTVQGENGEYLVRTNADGYTIIKKGEEDKPLDLVYNKEKRTWNAVADGQTFELITMNEDGTITFKQKDGTPMTVTPDMMGMSVARAAQNIHYSLQQDNFQRSKIITKTQNCHKDKFCVIFRGIQ